MILNPASNAAELKLNQITKHELLVNLRGSGCRIQIYKNREGLPR